MPITINVGLSKSAAPRTTVPLGPRATSVSRPVTICWTAMAGFHAKVKNATSRAGKP